MRPSISNVQLQLRFRRPENEAWGGVADIEATRFVGCTFTQCDAPRRVVFSAHFERTTFQSCNFPHAMFVDCVFADCSFDLCDLQSCTFRNCSLTECSFTDCDLMLAKFLDCRVNLRDVVNTNLEHVFVNRGSECTGDHLISSENFWIDEMFDKLAAESQDSQR